MANYAAEAFGADWAIAESGAATTAGLGPSLRDGGAFTALTVTGPDGFTMSKIVESAAPQDRVANMVAYSQAAIEFLEAAVMRKHRQRSKL